MIIDIKVHEFPLLIIKHKTADRKYIVLYIIAFKVHTDALILIKQEYWLLKEVAQKIYERHDLIYMLWLIY